MAATATARRRTRATLKPVPAPPAVPLAPVSKNIRSTTVSLGLVSFSAGLHGVAVGQDDPLETVCENGHDATKVRQTLKCPVCDDKTDPTKFTKAQIVGDTVTTLTTEQVQSLKDANVEAQGTLDLQVVQADDTYMLPTGSMYYIAPRGAADRRSYTLIAGVIGRRPQLAFLAEMSFSGGAPKLFRLITDEGLLIAKEIARPEAVRARPQVVPVTVDKEMEQLVEQLVDTKAKPFDPTAFANPHLARVAEALGQASPVTTSPAAVPAAGPASDNILDALKASLEAAGAPAAKKRTRRTG